MATTGPILASRSTDERKADVRQGVRNGLQYAVGFSVLATLIIAVKPSGRPIDALLIWLGVVAFYFVAGAAAGALYGLLRPIRTRLWGRLIIAFALLVLVYGSGTLAVWPLAAPDVPFVPYALTGLALVAALGLLLAPLYVLLFWLKGRS